VSNDLCLPPSPPGRTRRALSACEPYRELIAEALCLGRNTMAVSQDLLYGHGFTARTLRQCPTLRADAARQQAGRRLS
jgi:hypothetical protein